VSRSIRLISRLVALALLRRFLRVAPHPARRMYRRTRCLQGIPIDHETRRTGAHQPAMARGPDRRGDRSYRYRAEQDRSGPDLDRWQVDAEPTVFRGEGSAARLIEVLSRDGITVVASTYCKIEQRKSSIRDPVVRSVPLFWSMIRLVRYCIRMGHHHTLLRMSLDQSLWLFDIA
jgi:hypothetical protein